LHRVTSSEQKEGAETSDHVELKRDTSERTLA